MATTQIHVGDWTITLTKVINDLDIEVTNTHGSLIYTDAAALEIDHEEEFQERFTTQEIEDDFDKHGDPEDKLITTDSQLFGQFNISYNVDDDGHLNLWVHELTKKDIIEFKETSDFITTWKSTLKPQS